MIHCDSLDPEHRVKTCRDCRRIYMRNARAAGLSPEKRVGRRPFVLSALNIRVSRKYARCQELGGCIPSDVYVTRPFPQGDMELPECRRCRVPIRGKSAATRWKLSENTTLFRRKAA